MHMKVILSLFVVFLFSFPSQTQAQGRRGGGANRVSRTALLQLEQVQSELEISDEQKSDISEMREASRGNRNRGEGMGQRGNEKRGEGKGKRGEGKKNRGDQKRGEGRGEGGTRGQGRGQGGRSVEQLQAEVDKLSEVLLPHQMTRLSEIYVQVMGQRAIQDPLIEKELEITEDQKSEMKEIQDRMREAMRSMRESDDRETMREKMTEMQKESREKRMAVLTDDQREKLEEMKGDEFDLPRDALRGNRRGGRDRDRSDF